MKLHTKELGFIFKFLSVIIIASLLSFAILYFFMNKGVGTDYKTAFQAIAVVYKKMNYYIAAAVSVQLILSSFVIFFLALYYSHKIAGPMFRLKITIQQFLQGDDKEKVSFRSSDLLHEVAEDFTDFFTSLKNKFIKKKILNGSITGLDHFKNYCEKKYKDQQNADN